MNFKEEPRRPCAGLRAALPALVIGLAMALSVAPASAEFGFSSADVEFLNQDGTPATQAGSHPYEMTSSFTMNSTGAGSSTRPDGENRDVIAEQIAGLVGDATSVPICPTADFVSTQPPESKPVCKDNTAVGLTAVRVSTGGPITPVSSAVYRLASPPGVPVRLGFSILNVPIVLDVRVKDNPDYNVRASVPGIPQVLLFFGADLTLWGNPADPAHDPVRGDCLSIIGFSVGECTERPPDRPFLTLPGNCAEPLTTVFEADSWQEPGHWVATSVVTHDGATPPNPQPFTGCGKLGFAPEVSSKPTSTDAGSGTGLDFDIDFNQEGLTTPDGIAQSVIKKAQIELPEGITVDPSLAEGIGVCSPGELSSEQLATEPGDGCPSASSIGTVEVETPLLASTVGGTVYLAKPYDNEADDSLIAFYIVLKDKANGILIKLPAKVTPDPNTGQLVTTVDDLPQLPFSHFHFHFREGQRAPLITPSACGTYTARTELTPWATPDQPSVQLSSFEITGGVHGGPCPSGGVPPFDPSFSGGSLNNNAGSYSPFVMRLLRSDGEQDLTKFSATLPPGVVGNLSGVQKCSDAAIAAAKAKAGIEEREGASCPVGSELGDTLAGAGVGSALTYVPGKIYLAGPYHGAPLSVVAITPAVAGPFDAGTVVVQEALTLNPQTAEVEVDGAASDPIPHILKGIPLKLRELRVEVDRPDFTLNSTSCAPSSVKATLWGSFLDLLDPADDRSVDLSTRYQAANCLNLGFAPKLGLKLKGGTKRGNFPGLKAHYKPTAGHANVKDLVVRLPRSAFLEQGHIRTICTRVQFAADNCPKAAQYGYIRAWTPLLDEPLQGPVWLRSSNHKLPDLVFDLKGIVDVEVQTRIDSVNGGIRARVENAPDAPISRVILNMQGGRKGLIVNSRNLCTRKKARANVKGTGQNGKQFTRRPVLRSQCGKQRRAKRSSHSRVAGASAVG